MKCDEAAEFVSAICDGQTIPREFAEHIGQCEICRTRLTEYMAQGTELRRLASLESAGVPLNSWERIPRSARSWWRKGQETMRIPRFAFALLLITVFALASNLAIGKVRAHTSGKVLALIAKPPAGHTIQCILWLRRDGGYCGDEHTEGADGGHGVYTFRIISSTDGHIELGVRAFRVYRDVPKDEIENLPQTAYSFTPGETLHINVEGAGDLAISGELWDHYPSPGEFLDHMLANCRE